MKDFRKLSVWEESHKFTLEIYKLTESFPKKEEYRLISQIVRAASSIPTNIAEGCGRSTDKDFARFIVIAVGSACEVDYLLELSKDLGYMDELNYQKLHNQINTIRRMLISLLKKLKVN